MADQWVSSLLAKQEEDKKAESRELLSACQQILDSFAWKEGSENGISPFWKISESTREAFLEELKDDADKQFFAWAKK